MKNSDINIRDPFVMFEDGKYYMYVSFMPAESDDVHQQAMHVAESDTPCGPFTKAEKLLEPFSIDSHVVENEAGLFIFYSINDYEADRAGTYKLTYQATDALHRSTKKDVTITVVRPGEETP